MEAFRPFHRQPRIVPKVLDTVRHALPKNDLRGEFRVSLSEAEFEGCRWSRLLTRMTENSDGEWALIAMDLRDPSYTIAHSHVRTWEVADARFTMLHGYLHWQEDEAPVNVDIGCVQAMLISRGRDTLVVARIPHVEMPFLSMYAHSMMREYGSSTKPVVRHHNPVWWFGMMATDERALDQLCVLASLS